MLVIRNKQVSAFQDDLDEMNVPEVMKHLRAEYPTEAAEAGDERLREISRAALETSREFGLEQMACAYWFAAMMLLVGDRFYAYPVINELLSDTKISSENRIKNLIEQTTDEDWENAREYCRANETPEAGNV